MMQVVEILSEGRLKPVFYLVTFTQLKTTIHSLDYGRRKNTDCIIITGDNNGIEGSQSEQKIVKKKLRG